MYVHQFVILAVKIECLNKVSMREIICNILLFLCLNVNTDNFKDWENNVKYCIYIVDKFVVT